MICNRCLILEEREKEASYVLKFYEYQNLAEIYYAYNTVHRYTVTTVICNSLIIDN